MPRRARRSYPTNYATDLTDEQWAAIAPLVATPSPNGGRQTDIDRRAIVNALLYIHRTGCQWRMRPNDGPPMRSVRYYFDPWNRDGTFINITHSIIRLGCSEFRDMVMETCCGMHNFRIRLKRKKHSENQNKS